MANTPDSAEEKKRFGIVTRSLARLDHVCPVCPYAHKRPGSAFERLMRWHRNWCPAWAAHIEIYGEPKPLSR